MSAVPATEALEAHLVLWVKADPSCRVEFDPQAECKEKCCAREGFLVTGKKVRGYCMATIDIKSKGVPQVYCQTEANHKVAAKTNPDLTNTGARLLFCQLENFITAKKSKELSGNKVSKKRKQSQDNGGAAAAAAAPVTNATMGVCSCACS